MDKGQAIQASKKLSAEIFSLTPTALISLFEIDISDIAFDSGVINKVEFESGDFTFRFHNNIKLTNTSIFWKGNEFIAAPISAEGFEMSSKGVLPKPKLSITVSEEGVPTFSLLKQKLSEIGDLTGAKVTRIRTFAKYLDAKNFEHETSPIGFEPDNKVFFPLDVYFIERKSNENKSFLEFELSSVLDLENLSLPFRRIIQAKCSWTYRGLGCLYEANDRRTSEHDGATLPTSAPAIATINNELITDILQITRIVDKGKWQFGKPYAKGDSVFIEKSGIKYYFVAKSANTSIPPPSLSVWLSDACARDNFACGLRHGTQLRTSAFPATAKYS